MNLIDGLKHEIVRNRELEQAYMEIGVAGTFALIHIREDIKKAERAIEEGDTVGMLRMYKELKSKQ